jgi:hypothetical protein
MVDNKQLTNLNCLLLEKRSEYERGSIKSFFLHKNVPSHTTKPVHGMLETLSWEVLPYAAYSQDFVLPITISLH